MAGHTFSAASATTQANHHDPHDRHIGEGCDVGDGAVPLFPPPQSDGTDPVGRVKAAIARLADDVGAIFEPSVIAALTTLRAQDLAAYQRLRQKAKQANPACSVTELDRATRGTTSTPADERSTLDDLVALARAQCQLHHDADRQAVAVIRLPGRREVWRVQSSGFEDWLRAAYWRAYLDKAKDALRDMSKWLQEKQMTAFEVTYQGKTKTLQDWTKGINLRDRLRLPGPLAENWLVTSAHINLYYPPEPGKARAKVVTIEVTRKGRLNLHKFDAALQAQLEGYLVSLGILQKGQTLNAQESPPTDAPDLQPAFEH